MDPDLLTINPERLFETLLVVIVLSFFLERALALVFEHRWVIQRIAGRGLKEPTTFAVCLAVCRQWHFDAISSLFSKPSNWWGFAVTAAIIDGGSKASIALFQNVMGARSSAEAERNSLSTGSVHR